MGLIADRVEAYNAEKLEFGDKRKIEDVFIANTNPTILVSEF